MFDCADFALKNKFYTLSNKVPPWATFLGLVLTGLAVYAISKDSNKAQEDSSENQLKPSYLKKSI